MIMYNANSRQQMDGGAKKLRRIGNIKKIGFQMTAKRNEMKLYFLLILCCRGVNSTELVRQPRKLEFQHLSLGTESKLEPDDRSCLGCLARVSIECKYAGCLVERA